MAIRCFYMGLQFFPDDFWPPAIVKENTDPTSSLEDPVGNSRSSFAESTNTHPPRPTPTPDPRCDDAHVDIAAAECVSGESSIEFADLIGDDCLNMGDAVDVSTRPAWHTNIELIDEN